MTITGPELSAQYERASLQWPFITLTEQAFTLPRMLLYAVGSRETNLTNELGGVAWDGTRGHGVWQYEDGSHVIPAGFDGNVPLQCSVAASMLRGLFTNFAGEALAACAAYNVGAGAVAWSLQNGVPVDSGTAGGNYGADVIERMTYLQTTFSEDDMATWIAGYLVTYQGAIWVLPPDCSRRTGLHMAADAQALLATGRYVTLNLSTTTMASIPIR